MRVISNKALVDFAQRYPDAEAPLKAWRKIIEAGVFGNHAALKSPFNSVDRVGDYHVFNLGGNKFRLIAAIHFNRQMLFIRHVLTHTQYDRWRP